MLSLVLTLSLAAQPAVGELAPDFTVKTADGVELNLTQLTEKGAVVLAFFPKAFTPGCTAELTAYVKQYDTIKKAGGEVVVVSSDDDLTARKFKDSLKAPFHFVGDRKLELIKSYDVKGFLFPIAKRITFVIGAGRKVLAVHEGGDTMDPSKAAAVCSLHAGSAVKLVTDAADAGAP